MVKLFLQITGGLLAVLPEAVLRLVTWMLAWLVWFGFARRRQLILSNLHHAFPNQPAEWRVRIGRECLRRVVETALLSLAMPYLSEGRIRRIVTPSPRLRDLFARHRAAPHPILIGTPHMAHWEAGTVLPLIVGAPFPELGAVYRPLDNRAADAWIKRSRERFGMRLLSRREGFIEANHILGRGHCVAVLFDQNAGQRGALTTLFGRVCSTTAMPAALAARHAAEVVTIFPRHHGFWRIEMDTSPIAHDGTVEGITTAFNVWLETQLGTDDDLCASWLWGHQRWKSQDAPAARLRLEQKIDYLAADLQLRHLTALPRRTRLWIRLPNWLGDVVMVLPLLRAIRLGRPDAEITLLAKPPFLPLLEQLGVADRLRALPPPGAGSPAHFRRLREEYPDCYLLFTNSTRGDLEAWLTGCPQRFGIDRRGKWRPLLTRGFHPPADFEESRHHQFELWTNFLQHFGLTAAPDRTPFLSSVLRPPSSGIGLICGSENNPDKRWPVGHWRALITALPGQEFVLFGTAGDRSLTDAVAAGFGERVRNLAGRTSLPEFAAGLGACRLLVTNDTGGMHLANALGVPLVALFGPTNPVRTGPVFASPAVILQPPGCPATGGGSLSDLAPETVVAAVRAHLAK
ncbi:MAG: glycosyltransferase family 9 protein [Opitutales bacterium]